MCDRSSDPTEHDAARERPSALDVETHRAAYCRVMHPGQHDDGPYCVNRLGDAIAAEYARLTEPDAGEGTERITSTDQLEAEQRGLPIPFAHRPDTTKATLRAALERAAENNHREGGHWLGGGPGSFRECSDDYCREARAALQQPAVQPEHEHYWTDAPDDEEAWHCSICGLTEYPASPLYGSDSAAVQPEGGPE